MTQPLARPTSYMTKLANTTEQAHKHVTKYKDHIFVSLFSRVRQFGHARGLATQEV